MQRGLPAEPNAMPPRDDACLAVRLGPLNNPVLFAIGSGMEPAVRRRLAHTPLPPSPPPANFTKMVVFFEKIVKLGAVALCAPFGYGRRLPIETLENSRGRARFHARSFEPLNFNSFIVPL